MNFVLQSDIIYSHIYCFTLVNNNIFTKIKVENNNLNNQYL